MMFESAEGYKCTFSISFMDRSQILLHFSIVNYYHADEVLIFFFLSNKLCIPENPFVDQPQ